MTEQEKEQSAEMRHLMDEVALCTRCSKLCKDGWHLYFHIKLRHGGRQS